jgi:CRISPR-associated protein Csd1
MILQALAKYYDILSDDPKSDIAPPGYSSTGVSFGLNISEKGELLDVIPLFEQVQRGKKLEEKPRQIIVPERVKKSVNISPNFLCDNCVYILGISDKEAKDPEYNTRRFEAFREWNIEMLSKVEVPASKAVIAFLNSYAPAKGRNHPKILPHLETILKGGNLAFMFGGKFVHENPAIRQAWEKYKGSSKAELIQCLVTGEIAPLARLHPNLKGIRDANPTGATLVGFNARAYESYNREQGMNSPVSEQAAFAYTTALNFLLSSANENKKIHIGDTTVVYWAESEKKEYARAFLGLCEPEEVEFSIEEQTRPTRNTKAEKKLKKVADKVRRVQALDTNKLLEGLEENPRFYVLGLAPNAARVSIRFFHADPFDKIVEKIMKHYKDLEIIKEFEDQHTYLTIQDILKETISPKSSDKDASPLLAGSVFRSILENAPYPAALYNAIINRVRADQDEKFSKKINYARAAIIKAYLLRKYRNRPESKIQEVLVMSLNEQSTHPAYVLGRLFAWLEKLQHDAIGDVNAGIKDRYFTSACASPASVFPILLRLSQHHVSKVRQENKRTFNYDRRIGDILNLLDIANNPIPSRLSLDDQGAFILGYYHQRKDIFTPKKNDNVAENIELETN